MCLNVLSGCKFDLLLVGQNQGISFSLLSGLEKEEIQFVHKTGREVPSTIFQGS